MTSPRAGPSGSSGTRRTTGSSLMAGLFVGPVLFGLGALLYFGPRGLDLPEGEARAVHRSLLDTGPRRVPIGDSPVIHINGYERTCMDCHRLFPAADLPPAQLKQHTHILLDHGINDRCRNCHDVRDRDRLVLHTGETIGFSEAVRLCAKCHGPTFHDWQNGAHGRSNGYWDETRGARRRLGCTECHDPHRPRHPALDPMPPLPGPRTLRMGAPAPRAEGEAGGQRDPLREAIERDTRAREAP